MVVQPDLANAEHASVMVCPLSSHGIDAPLFRIDLKPTPQHGLEKPSQIMADKISAVKRERLRQVVGRPDDAAMVQVRRGLALRLGL